MLGLPARQAGQGEFDQSLGILAIRRDGLAQARFDPAHAEVVERLGIPFRIRRGHRPGVVAVANRRGDEASQLTLGFRDVVRKASRQLIARERKGSGRGRGIGVERLLEQTGQPGSNALRRVAGGTHLMIEIARENSHALIEDGHEEFVLRPKMLIERLVAESGFSEDVADRRLKTAGSLDQDKGRFDQSADLGLIRRAMARQRPLDGTRGVRGRPGRFKSRMLTRQVIVLHIQNGILDLRIPQPCHGVVFGSPCGGREANPVRKRGGGWRSMAIEGEGRELLVSRLLRTNAAAVPDRVAASLGDETLTHAELDRAADRWARRLHAAGVRRGNRVVGWMAGDLEVLTLFAGLSRLGAVFAPLNSAFNADEAIEVAGVAQPHFLIADGTKRALAAQVADSIGARCLERDVEDSSTPNSDAPYEDPELLETDAHMMFFTSGSTGRPKSVVLSHRANFLRSFQGVFRGDREVSVCMFPLFHMAPFTLALAAWQTRGEIVIVPKPTADALLEAVERRRANRLYCIPAVWRRILEADLDRYDLSTLVDVDTGTSATPIGLLRSLKERLPQASLRIFYGSTETGSATLLAGGDVFDRPGSVGRAAQGGEIRLAEDGEVCVRSPYLFDEYFGDPDATAAALQDGFFRTGDLGAFDADGFLSIVGRKKEIIRTGGESVSPNEVEVVLAEHPDIDEVAVVGIPDVDWGEIVCAVVVTKAKRAPSLADLGRLCEGRLAGYKHPRRLEVREGLPRTAATGQVQRALLVQEITSAPTN